LCGPIFAAEGSVAPCSTGPSREPPAGWSDSTASSRSRPRTSAAALKRAHRNVRFRIRGGSERPSGLVELSSVPFDELLAFDAGVFGAERERFLRVWIDRAPGRALACIRDGRLAGYGVVRPCKVGAKIGPLMADDEEVAEMLLAGLIAATDHGSEVFIDMPEANPRAQQLRVAREMEPSFETARMYLNGRPPEDPQRIFGVTTFEFG
jgi:Acetyltransferase (GNAT) domain